MALSILVAKILAVAYISMSIGALSGQLDLEKVYKDMKKSSSFLIFAAMISLIVGMLLVDAHNLWVKDWRVLITLIGWAGVIKGSLILMFPNHLKIWDPIFSCKFVKALPLFTLIFGLVFAYFGFVA